MLTEGHLENLKKVLPVMIEILEGEVCDDKFNMFSFRGINIQKPDMSGFTNRCVDYVNSNNCGTTGCAFGWLIMHKDFLPVFDDFDYFMVGNLERKLNYNTYVERIIGLDFLKTDTYEYLFEARGYEEDEVTRVSVLEKLKQFYNITFEHKYEM